MSLEIAQRGPACYLPVCERLRLLFVVVQLENRPLVNRAALRYLLVNVPLTDPTGPYHSISYLVGASAAAGFTGVTCLDANITALNFMAAADQIADLLDECHDIRTRLERQEQLTRREQWLYRHALKAVGLYPTAVQRAIDALRDPEDFYDYSLYRQSSTGENARAFAAICHQLERLVGHACILQHGLHQVDGDNDFPARPPAAHATHQHHTPRPGCANR